MYYNIRMKITELLNLKRKPQNLDFLDKKKIQGDYLEVILTQKCNLKCAHCLRGTARNVDITPQILDATFSKFVYLRDMTLGGGELSITPRLIKDVTASLKKNKVVVRSINLTTNGVVFNDEFAKNLLELKEYVMRSHIGVDPEMFDDKEPLIIRFSLDKFHIQEFQRRGIYLEDILDNAKKYQDAFGQNAVISSYNCDVDIINEGRGVTVNTGIKKVDNKNPRVVVYERQNSVLVGGFINVGATGEVVPNNLSYENEKLLSFGNILTDKMSTIMQRSNPHIVFTDSAYIKRYNRYYEEYLMPIRVVKRYYKSQAFKDRKAIEWLLKQRGQVLEDNNIKFLNNEPNQE